jgi:hypothetical protein
VVQSSLVPESRPAGSVPTVSDFMSGNDAAVPTVSVRSSGNAAAGPTDLGRNSGHGRAGPTGSGLFCPRLAGNRIVGTDASAFTGGIGRGRPISRTWLVRRRRNRGDRVFVTMISLRRLGDSCIAGRTGRRVPDFIPRSDGQCLAWSAAYVQGVAADPARFSIRPEDADLLVSTQSAYAAACGRKPCGGRGPEIPQP